MLLKAIIYHRFHKMFSFVGRKTPIPLPSPVRILQFYLSMALTIFAVLAFPFSKLEYESIHQSNMLDYTQNFDKYFVDLEQGSLYT